MSSRIRTRVPGVHSSRRTRRSSLLSKWYLWSAILEGARPSNKNFCQIRESRDGRKKRYTNPEPFLHIIRAIKDCDTIAPIWHKGNDPIGRCPIAIIVVLDVNLRADPRNQCGSPEHLHDILLTVLAALNVLLLATKW